MDLESTSYLSLAIVSFVSAVMPLVNAELALIGFAVGLPGSNPLLLVAVVTAAQMGGKATMYWLGRKGATIGRSKHSATLARWSHRFRGSSKSVGGLVFVSSLSGLPPFYVVSTLAGVFRTSFARFLVIGTLGRFLHFSAVGYLPLAVKTLAG